MANKTSLISLKKELLTLGSPKKALNSARFFKTAPGQYGEGDIFIGITAGEMTKALKDYTDLPLTDLEKLLRSKEHEFRTAALVILCAQFIKSTSEKEKKAIYDLYLSNTQWVNNWDLVDTSAEHIVGGYLENRSKAPLLKLARSKSVWERRIAMVATFEYIKKRESEQAIIIATILLHDRHDLIQKAVGWMLREVGKRCKEKELTDFLDKHHQTMPRTALRYAIERLSTAQKKKYMDRT